jgi:hypothetical protein
MGAYARFDQNLKSAYCAVRNGLRQRAARTRQTTKAASQQLVSDPAEPAGSGDDVGLVTLTREQRGHDGLITGFRKAPAGASNVLRHPKSLRMTSTTGSLVLP